MALAVLDFLLDWDIGTLILAAAVATVLVLVGSYGMALAWRRWKDGKRARAAQRKGLPPPAAPTGVRFHPTALLTKLPRPKVPALKAPKVRLSWPGKKD